MKELEFDIEDFSEYVEILDFNKFYDAVQEGLTIDKLDEELFNIHNENWFALACHLELKLSDLPELKSSQYSSDEYFEYGKEEYLVLNDREADDIEREHVESLIRDCYLWEYEREEKKSGHSNPLLTYLDLDRWIDDWCGDRGENLSGYNGIEYEYKVNDEWYFIYRIN